VQSFESLVDSIYEAAALPEAWPSVLHDLASNADAAGAGLLVRRSDAWIGWRISAAIADGLDAYLSSGASKNSIAHLRLAAADRAGFIAEDEYLDDPVTTAWATPYGLHHGAAAGITLPSGAYAIIQVQRRQGQPRFDQGAIDQLDAFRPHLARAALLASRWRLERLVAMTDALELIGLPAAVLDDSRRVLAANRLIEGMNTHVVWLARDKLTLTDPAAAKVLHQTLVAGPVGRSFPVQAGEDVAPLVAHLIPITGRSRDLFAGGLVLLVLGSLRGAEAPIVRSLYDLTPAETEVGVLLAQGLTPAEIAHRRSVSLDTVRNQIRVLLQKTGATRLGGLIALLARTMHTQ
jgi:DNA-binding CsgD family transcriptional regulator